MFFPIVPLYRPLFEVCREVYDAAQTRYKGRCTAPLLIDKKQKKLVSNESSDIMRMLNSVQLSGCTDVDLYPQHLRSEIDEVNDLVYDKVGLDVYSAIRPSFNSTNESTPTPRMSKWDGQAQKGKAQW